MPGNHLGGWSFEFTRCGGCELQQKMRKNTRFLTLCEENYLVNIGWNLARDGDLEASCQEHSIGTFGSGRFLIMDDREMVDPR